MAIQKCKGAALCTLFMLIVLATSVEAGPLAYGICQTGCNGLVVACYAAAGAVFGTVAAPAAPFAILACNAALGSCMLACIAAGCAPTP